MAISKNDRTRAKRRTLRVRTHLKKYSSLPRVSVFRSLKHIYAQIIDDSMLKTLASCSSLDLKDLSGDKKAIARSVGLELAKRAKERGIEHIVLDRGRFLYHGRVKALTDGLREGGLRI